MGRQTFVVAALLLFVAAISEADLHDRGTDTLGCRLIYDDDLDITWYDYTNTNTPNQRQIHLDWAAGLDINFNGIHYTDWRLPTMVDGPFVLGYDGTTTAGFNITSSEFGHLFYTELGNAGWYDTSGNPTGCNGSPPYCLTNTGDFQNLSTIMGYWFGTEYSADPYLGWTFNFQTGSQNDTYKTCDAYGIAVRDGDVEPVPLPGAVLLGVLGLGVAGTRLRRRREI